MTRFFITFLFFTFCNLTVFSQEEDKVYLAHGYSEMRIHYNIIEIIIHPNATFTRKDYTVSDEKYWKTYKEHTPGIMKGKITRSGKYNILTEYVDGQEGFHSFTTKIKDRKLIFFYPNRRGKMKKSFVYKRID